LVWYRWSVTLQCVSYHIILVRKGTAGTRLHARIHERVAPPAASHYNVSVACTLACVASFPSLSYSFFLRWPRACLSSLSSSSASFLIPTTGIRRSYEHLPTLLIDDCVYSRRTIPLPRHAHKTIYFLYRLTIHDTHDAIPAKQQR
jgi:hypothetical protein